MVQHFPFLIKGDTAPMLAMNSTVFLDTKYM